MIKQINYLLGVILITACFMPAAAKPVDTIDNYGIYVVAEKGYVKIEQYSHNDSLVDFKYLNEIPFVKRGDQQLKLIAYEKNIDPNNIVLELRSMDVVINIQKAKFTFKRMKEADMYELTVDSPVKNGSILQVQSWSFFNNMGVIMLGETQEELVKYFSQKQLPKAAVVVQYLEDALTAFPDNSELKNLQGYWNKAAENEKDKKDYEYVEEKWQKYEQAEKLTLKQRYLNELVGEINGYLNNHPNGSKAKEARDRKAFAEKKLKEYEKLL